MKITFPEKPADVAVLFIDGKEVKYQLPPATGTHSECFADSNYPTGVRRATGVEIAAYIYGALGYRKNEWADEERIMFPSLRHMRVPNVLTIVPKTRENRFGDLEGAMIIDEDLEGKGIEMETEVPKDLTDWKVSEGGIFKRSGRIVVPFDLWYTEGWNEENGAVIGIFGGVDSAVSLANVAKDSGRRRFLWIVNPIQISAPEKRVPVVRGDGAGRLLLGCLGDGDNRNGCAPRVLE